MQISAAKGDDVFVPTRFPRCRLLRRLRYSAEDSLGRLPMMLWAPMIGAVIGTWFQLHEHPTIIQHGLVVSVPSGNEAVAGAAIGAIGGIVIALISIFLLTDIRYRLKGDDVWKVVFRDGLREIGLCCKEGAILEPVEALGAEMAIECYLKTPSGIVLSSREPGRLNLHYLGLSEVGWCPFPRSELAEAGTYEARWYAPRGKRKLHDVARGKVEIPTPQEPQSPAPGSTRKSTGRGS